MVVVNTKKWTDWEKMDDMVRTLARYRHCIHSRKVSQAKSPKLLVINLKLK